MGKPFSPQHHWWSRIPPEQRRPLLSGRLIWNPFEFIHPFKLTAIWGAVVIVGAMVLTAVVVQGGSDSVAPMPSEDAIDAAVVIKGKPLPANAMGGLVPEIRGLDLQDTSHAVGIGGGSGPTVVLGLAHWDPHSQATISNLRAWLADAPKDAPILLVSSANDPERPGWPPSIWLAQEGWPQVFPVLMDSSDNRIFAALAGKAFPFALAIDAKGKVVDVHSGEMEGADIERLIASSTKSAAG